MNKDRDENLSAYLASEWIKDEDGNWYRRGCKPEKIPNQLDMFTEILGEERAKEIVAEQELTRIKSEKRQQKYKARHKRRSAFLRRMAFVSLFALFVIYIIAVLN